MKDFAPNSYSYADTSWDFRAGFSNPLAGKWDWQFAFGVDHKRFSLPDLDVPLFTDPEAPQIDDEIFNWRNRGFYQEFYQYPMEFLVNYNSKDSRFIPTSGQWARLSWGYVPVSDYKGIPEEGSDPNQYNHNYYAFNAVYQTYFLIGKKQYRLSKAENKANEKYLKSMNLKTTMDLLSPDQIRETLLERKVIALQFRMRQMWDVDPGGAPFIGFSQLGTTTPLRGYAGSVWDFNMYAVSCEYRWPMLELVDGVVFNEYGLLGRSWDNPQWENLRNSWGFGIRVRKPNMFLTRFQIGFHGLQGFNLIMTIQPEFI
jgi:outer membrane protein assembly factor BamA